MKKLHAIYIPIILNDSNFLRSHCNDLPQRSSFPSSSTPDFSRVQFMFERILIIKQRERKPEREEVSSYYLTFPFVLVGKLCKIQLVQSTQMGRKYFKLDLHFAPTDMSTVRSHLQHQLCGNRKRLKIQFFNISS